MSTTTEKDLYESIHDLPFVCRLNLPETAQQVYREAFNRAWRSANNYPAAQQEAWGEVRRRFERDSYGRWRTRGAQ
jgi:cation transport regulator ChaB